MPQDAKPGASTSAQPVWQPTANGILVQIPSGSVEVAVDRAGTFRLSFSRSGMPPAPTSVFLAPTDHATLPRAQVVHEGTMVGIATNFGALLIDGPTGAWTLRNAQGETLVRPVGANVRNAPMDSLAEFSPEHTPAPSAGHGPKEFEVCVGWRRDTPILGYGSGNGPISLQQSEGVSDVGNGRAVVPFLWCPQGYAMLAATADDAHPARWRADAGDSTVVWTFPGQVAHLYLAPAADLKAACRVLAELTGHPPVPPRWTFGYLQSRWGWKDRADIEATLREFRTRGFPVDAFILDFEWYTADPDYEVPPQGLPNFPDFTTNPELFPDACRQLAEFHAQGLEIVAIRKPRLGDAATLKEMRAKGWMLPHGPEGARKWSVREIDFRRAGFRQWYAERMRPLVAAGFDAWWNDEGESSFITYYYWNLAEYELAKAVRPRSRFWSLNRAFIPGMQRFGATAWTGDAYATWDALAATPTHLLNWGLAGMPYAGCDIGGFRGEATPELFVRWIQAAVFFPMMRAHTSHEWTPRFPWLFGAQAEPALRHALELRYRLLPYVYSLAHDAHSSGLPIMRPLVMEFPEDPLVANMSDQWLLGERLMAAPLLRPGNARQVYLPAGAWHRLGSGESLEGSRVLQVMASLDEVPAFVRAGTILPLGAVVPSTAALPGGPLEVQIYPGRDATFTLIEDDGTTVDYTDGHVRTVIFAWDDERRVLTWTVAGSYDGADVFRSVRVNLMGGSATSGHEQALEPRGKIAFSA